jgi:hypothetical protein
MARAGHETSNLLRGCDCDRASAKLKSRVRRSYCADEFVLEYAAPNRAYYEKPGQLAGELIGVDA